MDESMKLVAGMPLRQSEIILGLVNRCSCCEGEDDFRRIMQDLKLLINFTFWKVSIVAIDKNYQMVTHQRTVDDSLTISTFPRKWEQKYQRHNLLEVDPILHKNFTQHNFGCIQRWSETFENVQCEQQKKFIETLSKFAIISDGLSVGCKTANKYEGSIVSLSGNVDFQPRSKQFLKILAPHFHLALVKIKSHKTRDLVTRQQKEVLSLIQEGFSRSQVSKLMSISVGDVKYHLSQIYKKLGVNTQASAVGKALSLGIIGLR
ncbi:MAG: hypothetical protein COB67_07955 [SAR324 cluster bacterium]|uniref:HTH luxR-type domain-containing protein n=1 Tax=SAR324 cluster bacterium TaxID=2024889 RepID=A0A2A4T274_9DELT|nr:MAG: hypothetical protein COB67_07955 [SAR324 cluster bacterium]